MAHRTPTPRPLRAAGVLLRALAGLIVLAALIGGVPPALLGFGSQPTELSGGLGLLLEQDDGTLFLTVLTCIGWTAWAAFTFSVAVEVVAVARRRSAPRIRGLGGMQSLAGFLIGGIVLLAPTAASAATTTPAAAITQTQDASTSTPAGAPTAGAAVGAAASGGPTHTVAGATETPWDLAEHHLGDGQRWRDIAALNPHIPELASGDQYLAKDTVITLPPDARSPAPAATADGARTQLEGRALAGGTGEDEHVVTVEPGDYLSKIAQEELGDATQWPKLFQASRDTPQPDGLPEITDPDQIYAGQQVTVPEIENPDGAETTPPPRQPGGDHTPDGAEEAPAPRLPEPATPSGRPAGQPGQDRGSPSAASVAPEPGATAHPSTVPSAPASSAAATPSNVPPTPAAPATSPTNSNSPSGLHLVLGAGALLAASVTGALALRRTLQRRRRKPGQKIVIASETSTAEARLAAAAEPGSAARLDAALRTLAHHINNGADESGSREVPELRAARIGTRTVEVLPEELTQDPAAPFVPGRGGWWTLPADAGLLAEETARDVSAPYPGLVTLGSTASGELLLVNLAQLPALLLDGDPVHVTEVCTSIALELSMSPWATDIEIIAVGFGEELPTLLPTMRIAHMREPAHALRDLNARVLEAHQVPDAGYQPYVVLCATELEADLAWQFADAIAHAGKVPVTLIAPAGTAAARFPEADILNASQSEPQMLGHIGTTITVQRLEHDAYQQITTALKTSQEPAEPAEGPWEDVPDEPSRPRQPRPPAAQPAPSPLSSRAPAGDAGVHVFPALLAASTDPSGLPVASPAPYATGPADEAGPATTASTPPRPSPNGAASAAEPEPIQRQEGTQDLHAPEIRVLGPVEVTGVDHSGHGPRIAQLAALLYFRPGRSAETLCADMNPAHPWSMDTLNARLRGLRGALGHDPAGAPYVPRRKTGNDPYRLAAGVRCDWTRFLHLAERALPQGADGLDDLEEALGLVRGRPFGGQPLPWAEPHVQEITTRIIDVAHTVATHRTAEGPHHDLSAARHAIATGLEADPTAELLWRDLMRLEAAHGNRSGLQNVISRLQEINESLDFSPEPETTQLIGELRTQLGTPAHDARHA
ncbi:hypothetical protein [Streptomyces sp. NPDC093094]|uniref:hypothetical protein n=1 Tax=Streptomyces sp. NPDC093094 TaxID=3366026 RepID=UPI003823718C